MNNENWTPKLGEWVLVRSLGNDEWKKRIFITKIEGAAYPFITVYFESEDRFKNGEKFDIDYWKQIKQIKQSYTKQEIAKALNIPVEELIIEDIV